MSKVQQLFPHVLNAIIDSPNQELPLSNLVEFVKRMSQLKNLLVNEEEVLETLRIGIDFGLIINKDNMFGITFNPFRSNDRRRQSLKDLSQEEDNGAVKETRTRGYKGVVLNYSEGESESDLIYSSDVNSSS